MVLTKITISCFAFWILVCREPATAHRNQHAFTDQTTRATKLLAGDGACLAASSAVALVNTTVQLQAVQQLDLGSTTASMQQALSQYLHTSDCNIQIQFNTSSTCLTASSSNTSATCPDSTYVCRGVVQVPVNVYNAIQDSTCTPDDRTSTFPCAGSTIDLTTYLDVQQGQCCLQCPDQPDCSTDPTAASAYAPEGAAESPPQCSNFSVSVAVGDRLTGSAAQAQLADAVNNGLLDQYLHAAGLLDTTALSVGPTGQPAVLQGCT